MLSGIYAEVCPARGLRTVPIKYGATPCGHSIRQATVSEGHEHEAGETLNFFLKCVRVKNLNFIKNIYSLILFTFYGYRSKKQI